jgi:hypothetical protein
LAARVLKQDVGKAAAVEIASSDGVPSPGWRTTRAKQLLGKNRRLWYTYALGRIRRQPPGGDKGKAFCAIYVLGASCAEAEREGKFFV